MPEQIWNPGPDPSPVVYTVPGRGEIIPLACQALYDGSGASGDYVPALVFRSQAGHVIARAILDVTIAAGDDAAVSWFPGVKHSGQPVAWATAYNLDSPPFPDAQTVASGATDALGFANATASGGAVTFITGSLPNDAFVLAKTGCYLIQTDAIWDDVVTGSYFRYVTFSGHRDALDSGSDSLAADGTHLYVKESYLFFPVIAGLGFQILVHNGDGANAHDVLGAHLTIAYLGPLGGSGWFQQ